MSPRDPLKGALRPFGLRGLEVRVRLEPRDLWVGVFWDREPLPIFGGSVVSVYVCFLPCIPIRLSWLSRRPGGAS